MAKYGEYSGINDCVVAIYQKGKIKHIIENVNCETVFLHEDYHKNGIRELNFDYMENGTELTASVEITMENSFSVFPSWMKDKLEVNL